MGDWQGSEASGSKTIAQLELLLRCAVFTQAAVAPPQQEQQLKMQNIDPVAGTLALDDSIKTALRASVQLLPCVFDGHIVSFGVFGTVLALFTVFSSDNAASSVVIEISKQIQHAPSISSCLMPAKGLDLLVRQIHATGKNNFNSY